MKLSIGGEAKKYQASSGGTYFLQEDKTNNKPYWIHQSGDMAIWWSTIERWIVGGFEDLGSSRGGILGTSNNDSPPNQITSNGWQYANNGWHDTNGVHFEDWTFKQGNFLHSLCKNFLHAEFKPLSHLKLHSHFYNELYSWKTF